MQKMVTVWIADSNQIPTRLQRALVKHGNNLSLIRYQTTPHCDARLEVSDWTVRWEKEPYPLR